MRKNAKRILSFVIVLMLAVTMLIPMGAINASAAGFTVVVSASKTTLNPGDSFDVTVTLNNIPGTIKSGSIDIPVDNTFIDTTAGQYSYVKATGNNITSNGGTWNSTAGAFRLAITDMNGYVTGSSPLVLGKFVLKVKSKLGSTGLGWTGKLINVVSTAPFKDTSNVVQTATFDPTNIPLSIVSANTPVDGIAIDKTSLALSVGGTDTITATVSPSGATNKTVNWTSSDDTVASVAGGVVTAKKVGTATIRATTADGGFYKECSVTVGKAVPTIGLALTDIGNKGLTITVGNSVAAQDYQVWTQQIDASGVAQGWVLQKAFTAAFTAGNTVAFNVAALTPSYMVYIRYKGADGIIYQVSKQVVIDAAATPVITALNVAGETQYDGVVYATSLKTFNLEAFADCTAGMNYEWSNATSALGSNSTYAFTPSASGEYVIFLKVSNALNSELFAVKKVKFVITDANAPFAYINANAPLVSSVSNGNVNLNLGSNFSNSLGNTPLFRFALAEPFKGSQFNVPFGGSASTSVKVKYPGFYDAIGYISSGDRNVDEDFIIKSVNVPRTSGGTASLSTTTDLADGTYTITATGAGLSGMGYQYSFWRVDANGRNLVKNWSSDNTLTWKPTRDGNYTIIVRVRGDKDNNGESIVSAKFGTFEAAKNLNFTIGSPSAFAGASLAVSDSPTKRNPVTLTVNGVATDAVYAFSVYDVNRGGVSIRGFAPSNEVVWVPDKPGSYIITAKINGQASFGYADATVTANVTVN